MAGRLSLAERARIEALTDAGAKPDEIAEMIGRGRSPGEPGRSPDFVLRIRVRE